MNDIVFKEKFIGFVDVLGFKNMVDSAEKGMAMSLPELVEMLRELGTSAETKRIQMNGPVICPGSTYVQRGLDFQLTQISDCLIVSTEISPAGIINLINKCWSSVMLLLTKGIMCRGYITRGLIYHTETQFIGSGYQEAYQKESQVTAFRRKADERGTPFVEVDPIVCDYVRDQSDKCVKEMFSRMVKTDANVTALFPFQRLAHTFLIAGGVGYAFDAEKERRSNQNMRRGLETFKKRVEALVDQSNPTAVSKAEHYIAALNVQLEICNDIDGMIDVVSRSYNPKRAG